jgi:uncharacterized membrane protein
MEIKPAVELVRQTFEVVGIVAMVSGAAYAAYTYAVALLARTDGALAFSGLRRNVGQSILLGLEFLVAADIINSVAIDPTFASVGVLAMIVAVRTFLSWSLDVEINGHWPWKQSESRPFTN